jgi:hypothetical protein
MHVPLLWRGLRIFYFPYFIHSFKPYQEMKKHLFSATLILLGATAGWSQTIVKTYELHAVAEGNFGTPNGDVFFRSTHANPATLSAGLYATANSTTGIDVLQDFEIAGNKAILLSKSSGFRIIVADYPSYTQVTQFTNAGAPQSVVKVSNATAYVSCSNPATVQKISLLNNTITPITHAAITSSSSSMIASGGFVYMALGANIVKIDTLTDAVVSTFNPQIGTIKNLDYDVATAAIWALGSVSGTSAAIRIATTNGDALGMPISFTGVSNARLLRYNNEKLYFWSGKNLHIYDIQSPVLPTTSVYLSALSGSWDFAYDRSFALDKASGDFAIATASAFAASSIVEVVDGTTFAVIRTDTITGARGINEMMLKTFTDVIWGAPVPDVAELPTINEPCAATVVAPTATGENGTVTATTTDETEITEQGTYTITWTYTDDNGTATQEQTVVINDDTAPVPTTATLPALAGACPFVTTAPTATDNCAGNLTATTVDPTTYNAAGTYTIHWTYTDGNGNNAAQTQTLTVSCSAAGLNETAALTGFNTYPNPAAEAVWISGSAANGTFEVIVVNQLGQAVKNISYTGTETQIDVQDMPNGLYYVQVQETATQAVATYKLTIAH